MNAKSLFGAFSVAIAIFFVWVFVVTSWGEMRALKTSLAEHKQVLLERSAILDSFIAQRAAYQKIMSSEDAKNFLDLIPAKKNTPELLSAAQAIAINSGVQLKSIQFGAQESTKASAPQPYMTMTMIMEGSGTYSALRSYLDNVETYVRVLDVRSLDISPSQQGGLLTFKIEAVTYYIK